MKQEIFKSMYNQIGLEEEQKTRIWKKLQASTEDGDAAKRARLTVRVTAFAGLFLLSGMTVFAAGRFSLVDRFAKAMNLNPKNEQTLTQEQKDIYEQYGQVLGNEIETSYGTLKLEAALYDSQFLIIPYSYSFYTEDADIENAVSGISINNIFYRVLPDSEHTGYVFDSIGWLRNHNESDDGVSIGSYILSPYTGETFDQGDVIQVYTVPDTLHLEDEKIFFEFTLGERLESVDVAIDASAHKILEDKGLFIEKISVSPISISYSGLSDGKYAFPISVVLKDGSIMDGEKNYGGQSREDNKGRMKEDYPYLITYDRLFPAPINVEEIEGIRIHVGKTDIWIPMEEE